MPTIKKWTQSFYYGWVIVLIAGFGIFFSGPGQTYSNAVYIDEYIRHFGWSRSEVSGIYSAATLCEGLLMMFVGQLVDKIGQRKMMAIVGAILGIACIYNSFVTNIWMMAVGFFLIRLFGQGSMTLVPNTLVPQWFIQKRGRALSFMAIGSFASAAFFPVANVWLIERWGWQTSWQIWGGLLLVFFVPLVLFGVRNKPEDIGLLPDGVKKKASSTDMNDEASIFAEVSWTLREAAKTRAFWTILLCVSIPALVNTGMTFHLVSIMGENKLSPQIAATILSLMAIVGFPISFISGFILEKIRTNLLLLAIFMIEITLLILLLLLNSMWMAIVFGVLWGVANGIERITLNIIWPNYFGRKYLGSIKGVAVTFMVVGSAFGPLPLGIGFDMFQSYTQVLLLFLLFPAVGLISAILTKKPEKVNYKELAS